MEKDAFKLLELFQRLGKASYETETEFLAKEIPILVSTLGYAESQLFFEVGLSGIGKLSMRADAVVAPERTSNPWILIETKVRKRKVAGYEINDWKKQLINYSVISQAKYALLLEPSMLFLIDGNDTYEISFNAINEELVSKVYEILKCPPNLVNMQQNNVNIPIVANLTFDNFSLNLEEYSRNLENAKNAKTNDEKKKTFESLAKRLFEGMPFLTCRNLDLRTSSSEIDIVVEYHGWHKPTMFDQSGRFCLVECKNWKSSVGAKDVRDFLGKLQKTRVKLGILFARNGITGLESGGDALREINYTNDKHDIQILVVAEEDLVNIERGANFYEILDRKMFQLRFDVLSF